MRLIFILNNTLLSSACTSPTYPTTSVQRELIYYHLMSKLCYFYYSRTYLHPIPFDCELQWTAVSQLPDDKPWRIPYSVIHIFPFQLSQKGSTDLQNTSLKCFLPPISICTPSLGECLAVYFCLHNISEGRFIFFLMMTLSLDCCCAERVSKAHCFCRAERGWWFSPWKKSH